MTWLHNVDNIRQKDIKYWIRCQLEKKDPGWIRDKHPASRIHNTDCTGGWGLCPVESVRYYTVDWVAKDTVPPLSHIHSSTPAPKSQFSCLGFLLDQNSLTSYKNIRWSHFRWFFPWVVCVHCYTLNSYNLYNKKCSCKSQLRKCNKHRILYCTGVAKIMYIRIDVTRAIISIYIIYAGERYWTVLYTSD